MTLITVVKPTKAEGTSPTELIGRGLATQLLAAGEKVRVLAEEGLTAGWPEGVEVIEGSIAHPGETPNAFDNIKRLFLAGASPATISACLELAKKAGVERIVVLSSHGPEYEVNYPPETWFWLAIEKAVEQSGMEWVHIRPSAVMGAVFEGSYPATGSDWAKTIKTEGIVHEAFITKGYYPFIHEDDLTAVAAVALQKDVYLGKILEAVNVPISTQERIDLIGKAIGRKVKANELTPAQGRERWKNQGWPDGAIDVTLYSLEEYGTQLNELTQWTLDQDPSVEAIIGRPLRTFEEWTKENAKRFIS